MNIAGNEMYSLLMVLIFLIVLVLILFLQNLRFAFMISYYETKLKNRGVDISRVEQMPFWKLWLN